MVHKPVFSPARTHAYDPAMSGAGFWHDARRWFGGPDAPDSACQWPWLCRGILVAAQMATVVITWPSWQRREMPPLLPLLPVPQADVGGIVLGSLGLVFFRPLVGLPLHALLLLYAFVADQSRMMPHTISLFLLTCGTTGRPAAALVARGSLVSLWFFAGIHKLTSRDFFLETTPWLLSHVAPEAAGHWAAALGIAIGTLEISLACGCLVPALRRATAGAACLFHAGTLALLSPLVIGWNPEVWPWNAALAGASPLLLLPWRGRGLGDIWQQAAPWARRVAVGLLVLPVGYWFGLVDAYLAHCLYSTNVPRAIVCTPFSRVDLLARCGRLGVQVPPAHRHFERLFRGVGRPGEWLEVEDPRWIARLLGFERRKVRWADLVSRDRESGPP